MSVEDGVRLDLGWGKERAGGEARGRRRGKVEGAEGKVEIRAKMQAAPPILTFLKP